MWSRAARACAAPSTASTVVMRCPVTNSIRSHQCEPMSANVIDAPHCAGSDRHPPGAAADIESCR